jgi:protein-S-isoprenylcysteine O-methyltransferase Ste14
MMLRLVVLTVAMLAVYGAFMFGFAWTLAWPQAWVFLVEVGLTSVGLGLWLERNDPALFAERLGSPVRKDQTPWDRLFMTGAILAFCAWTAFIGWERRTGARLPILIEALGFILIAACMGMTLLTFRANSFAAPVVKLQEGQTVADTGPYRFVRHPMYAGAILYFVGVPLLLGVWRGLIIVPLLVVFLGVRAVGEEKLLMGGLAGYPDYVRRVRYRFAPGVW